MEDERKHADESSESGDGETAITPKKRGRPAKPNKVMKIPTGRGRGRPAKNSNGGSIPDKKKRVVEASDDDNEEDDPIANGDEVVTSGRGRPPKEGKRKIGHTVEPTGKGRGRPKKAPKSDVDDDTGEENDDDEDANRSYERKDVKDKKPKKGRGRPKKVVHSEDEDDYDDEERRPVGRPSTGAASLNIVRTGRGQGRPKKAVAATAAKRASTDATNGSSVPKKRGRPSANKTGSSGGYQPTGKPRGRPKTTGNASVELLVESEDDDEGEVSIDERDVVRKHKNDKEEEELEDGEEKEDEDEVSRPVKLVAA